MFELIEHSLDDTDCHADVFLSHTDDTAIIFRQQKTTFETTKTTINEE